MQDQLKKIREACIKANPSILDLVFGCEVEYNVPGTRTCLVRARAINMTVGHFPPLDDIMFLHLDNGERYPMDNVDFTIIGRKIGLADIFHLLGTLGELSKKNMHSIVFYYNLLDDDITHQSPEFIAFAARLLGNEAGK